jgi:hypothetical protein
MKPGTLVRVKDSEQIEPHFRGRTGVVKSADEWHKEGYRIVLVSFEDTAEVVCFFDLRLEELDLKGT